MPYQENHSLPAPPQLASIDGTRCGACGDVRLDQTLKDGTVQAAIRAELD